MAPSLSVRAASLSPLLTIHGFLGYLERDAAGELERRYVERIRAAAHTMRRFLDDLLELLRIGRMVIPGERMSRRRKLIPACGRSASLSVRTST